MNIEDLLRDTLSDMAGEEPPPRPERFLQATGVRPRRRRLALATGMAAAAVAAVAVGSSLAVERLSSGPGSEPRPAAARTTGVWPAPPLAKVWPQAVHTVPATLPNGMGFHPELFLDDHTVLARTGKGTTGDRARFWAYDLDSGKARMLIDFVPPPRTDATSPVVSGGGRLVWWTVSWGKVKGALDIWTAPVTGGAARKVTSFPQTMKYGDIGALSVVGTKIVWSRAIDGGLYQARLSGGRPEPIPGTRGLDLLQWPWAAPRPAADAFAGQPTFTRLINVQTGERRDAALPPDEASRCSLTWCLSQGEHPVARHRDGSAARTLPAPTEGHEGLAVDRFVMLRTTWKDGDMTLALYDLSTGQAGDLGVRLNIRSNAATTFLNHNDVDLGYGNPGLFSYDLAGKKVVVNLAAIR